jgi:hypothetical protein
MSDDLTPEAVERLAADLDLARKVMFDMGTFETGQVICKEAAATLRALSERLAELKSDLQFMTANRNKWQDSATQRWFRAEAAEAALATARADALREAAKLPVAGYRHGYPRSYGMCWEYLPPDHKNPNMIEWSPMVDTAAILALAGEKPNE